MRFLPRSIHHLYANLAGYFWLPCPLCKEMFGGHECNGANLMKSWGHGVAVCPACEQKADELNETNFGVTKL